MLMRISSIVFAVPGIVLLVLYGIELSSLSQCQELGQFYDAVNKQCVLNEPPFSSFYMRHSMLVNSLLSLASLGALTMCFAMLGKAKAKA